MKDIQSLRDNRRINIKKVGVKTISYPITVLDKANSLQHTVAVVNMYVNLPHHFKGTHMSRFVEILTRIHGEITLRNFRLILAEMKKRLDAEAAHMEIAFPYFLQKMPGGNSMVTNRFECKMHGSLDTREELTLEIKVPIVLPLQNPVSGALPASMGQWGRATVAVRFRTFLWLEDLIGLIEREISLAGGAGSTDSRDAGDISVESLTARLGRALAGETALNWFSVTVENMGAGYSTFATLERHTHRTAGEPIP